MEKWVDRAGIRRLRAKRRNRKIPFSAICQWTAVKEIKSSRPFNLRTIRVRCAIQIVSEKPIRDSDVYDD